MIRHGSGVSAGPGRPWGKHSVQSAQPRDFGVLVLVIGLFLTLFVVTLLVGGPVR